MNKKDFISLLVVIISIGAVIIGFIILFSFSKSTISNPTTAVKDGDISQNVITNDVGEYSFDVRPDFVCPLVGFGESEYEAIPTPTDEKWCASYFSDIGLYWEQRAYIEKDPRYCSLINNNHYRWTCYARLARLKADHSICRVAIDQWGCELSVQVRSTDLFINADAEKDIKPIAEKVMQALGTRNMKALSILVHPIKGVYFSVDWDFPEDFDKSSDWPDYGGTQAKSNHHFTRDQLTDVYGSTEKKLFDAWIREPSAIMTFKEFFDRSVFYIHADLSKTKLVTLYYTVGRISPKGSIFLFNPGAIASYRTPLIKTLTPETSMLRDGNQILEVVHQLLFEKYQDQWFLIGVFQDELTLGDVSG